MFHIESCHCPAFLPDVPVGKGPRYQAGAIVWQRTPVGVQVLLVERSSGKGWGIPKGGIESGESSQVAALREAWEEAGVEPKSLIQDLGEMRYVKRNRDQVVQLHAVEAQRLFNEWPEALLRRRAWFSLEDAIREVDRFLGLERALRSLQPVTNFKLVA
ncbi:MAG: NUDIX hydrolase [Planctomycetota bacterium]|jgi:8-oxo-dGTP pyrophosphatase MutT (NUDIX family)|nr:MAG: NUDIX hydrolase [Phycisphaera sp. TMED24]